MEQNVLLGVGQLESNSREVVPKVSENIFWYSGNTRSKTAIDFRKSFTIRKVKNDSVDSILIANYLRIFASNDFSLPNEKLIELKQLEL